MNTNQRDAKATPGTGPLLLGFVVTLVLALLTIGFIVFDFQRAERAAAQLGDIGQHATYYLGDVGEQLARLRFHVAFGLQQSSEEFGRGQPILSGIESTLQNDIDGLATGLDPVSRQRWTALRPEIERLRNVMADAASSIRIGQTSRAAGRLARSAASDARLHDAIDEVEQTHRQVMLAALQGEQQRASFVRMRAAIMAGGFVAGMLAIWAIVLMRLRRQGHLIAEKTARILSLNADLDAFAGRVAHDLKNALGPLVMAPWMLRQSAADSTRVLEVADRTERCSRRAIAVVDSLLAFSRASHGGEVGESSDLPSAVKDVLEELAPLVAQFDVSVEVDEIPELHVRCSQGLLHVVLANVCGNAVKYLEGRVDRRVHISARRQDSECRIEVADTGPGIPKAAQEKIFEPFFRIAGRRGAGTGIGLATVRRILDARGGRIAVESAEGLGSRFQIWLPLAPPSG